MESGLKLCAVVLLGATLGCGRIPHSPEALERKQRTTGQGGFALLDENETGYAIRDIGSDVERPLSSVDFSRSQVSPQEEVALREAGFSELLVRGEEQDGTFFVSEAWRGLPGIAVSEKEVFGRPERREPPRECVAAPCPNLLLHPLNAHSTEELSAYVFDAPTLPPALDTAWVLREMHVNGALVAGHWATGASFPGGVELLFQVRQLFIRFPIAQSPCGYPRPIQCGDGERRIHIRDEDRCIYPVGCVPSPQSCLPPVAECPSGYSLRQWAAAPDGCNLAACDPTFVGEVDD